MKMGKRRRAASNSVIRSSSRAGKDNVGTGIEKLNQLKLFPESIELKSAGVPGAIRLPPNALLSCTSTYEMFWVADGIRLKNALLPGDVLRTSKSMPFVP